MGNLKSAIIVAGGNGLRMESDIPKQFIEVAGQPILMHTLQKFYSYDNEMQLILVLPEPHLDYWKKLCTRYDFNIKHSLIVGGSTRFESVLNGLKAANNTNIIAVHDGVRPLVSHKTIDACFKAAAELGAAIPVTECIESLRQLTEHGSRSVDRSKFRAVQTPQVFDSKLLKQAYEQAYSPLFTDDASVIESFWLTSNANSNSKITLIEGNIDNIKITTKFDLAIAQLLLDKTNKQ